MIWLGQSCDLMETRWCGDGVPSAWRTDHFAAELPISIATTAFIDRAGWTDRVTAMPRCSLLADFDRINSQLAPTGAAAGDVV